VTATVLLTNKSSLFQFQKDSTTNTNQEIIEASSNLNLISSSKKKIEQHKLSTQRLGYDPIVSETLKVYKISHVVEPDTTMILKITTCDDCGDTSWSNDNNDIIWSIQPIGDIGTVSYDTTSTSSTIHALFKGANENFIIQASINNVLIINEVATCKYIRRELRTVNSKDRLRYINALKIMYTLNQDDGEEKYGDNFLSSDHLVAIHNTDAQFHGNLYFFTSHPALQIKFEKSLLSIDAGVVLNYWDFMKDANLNRDWYKSDIYSDELFGPVATFKKDNYRISGHFHDVKLVYDKDSIKFPDATHSPRGYLGSLTQTTSSKHLQRSNSYCGFRSTQGQVDGSHMITCLDNYENDHDFRQLDICFEEKVHANLHMMHAGQWDCSVDWGDFYEEHKVWLDEDLFSIVAIIMSSITGEFFTDGYVSCPSSCSNTDDGTDDDSSSTCSCSSATSGINSPEDVDSLTKAERMSLLTSTWKSIGTSLNADEFIKFRKSYDMDGTIFNNVFVPMNTKVDIKSINLDKIMDNTKLDLLNRLILKTVLFQGSYGIMMTGAAPTDPLFWVMHPIFDKATHVLRLSSRYNTQSFVWNNIKGFEKYNEMTPFTYVDFKPYLDTSKYETTKGKYLKNSELWEIIHPSSEAVYYIYDQFTEWGNVNFDPFSTRSVK